MIDFKLTIIKDIFIPVILSIITYFVFEIINTNKHAIEDEKYAVELLKDVYGAENCTQGLSYLNILNRTSSSLDMNLKNHLEQFIFNHYIQKYRKAMSENDTNEINDIREGLTNFKDTAIINKLAIETDNVALKNQIKQKYYDANGLEKLGLKAIQDSNYSQAINLFTQIDQVYPTFHSASEIKKLLQWANMQKMSPQLHQLVKDSINKQYMWHVDPSLKLY